MVTSDNDLLHEPGDLVTRTSLTQRSKLRINYQLVETRHDRRTQSPRFCEMKAPAREPYYTPLHGHLR